MTDAISLIDSRVRLRDETNADSFETWLKRFPATTARAYRYDVLAFAGYLGYTVYRLTRIAEDRLVILRRVHEWRDHLRAAKKSTATEARALAALKSYFTFCVEVGVMESNPLSAMRIPRVHNGVKEVLTREEVGSMLALAVTHHRDYCILRMLAELGLRRHELTSLTISSLSKTVSSRTLVRVIGKWDKERIIPLTGQLVEALGHYLETLGPIRPEEPLFRNQNGQPLTDQTIYNIVTHYADLAKIQKRVTPHAFRHFVVTDAAEAGCNAMETKSLTGHASVTTVERYTHLDSIYTVDRIQRKRGLG